MSLQDYQQGRVLLFDTETNGFLKQTNTLHCMVIYDLTADKFYIFDPEHENPAKGVRMLMEADCIVAHNAHSFDIPALKKLYPWFEPPKVLDTVVLARLIFPNIKDSDFSRHRRGKLPAELIGTHKLEAWGYRFGEYKGEWKDFSKWSRAMTEYCVQDVRVLKRLYEECMSRSEGLEEAIDLENRVQHIISRQERYGFLFDLGKAEQLHLTLVSRRDDLLLNLRQAFGPVCIQGEEFTPKKDLKRYGYKAGCPMTKVSFEDFNPGSAVHIIKALKRKYKWEPVTFTENSGEPSTCNEVLENLPYPEGKLLAEYADVSKLIGMLATGEKAWLKMFDPDDGRMHGYVNTMGAVTYRMTHNNPNMAQVPKVGKPFGAECRELFCVPQKGKKLMGCDASGIEARCLGHFMAFYDGGAYIQVILQGRKEDGTDIHSVNMKALGITDRDKAKTWFYAWLYGAGDEKLAAILGCSVAEAKRKRAMFLENLPALKKLVEAVKAKGQATKTLKGLDGRPLYIRALHSALNTLFQSAGALIMKRALVFLDEMLQGAMLIPGVNYEFVANVHDEWQVECDEEHADFIGKCAVQAIVKAGEYYKFRCPLDGEYKIGDNWSGTH